MIEDIFLTYVNEGTNNNPQFFSAVYEQVKKHMAMDLSPVEKILPIIKELSIIADPQIFIESMSKWGGTNHYDDGFSFELLHAVEAITCDRISFYHHDIKYLNKIGNDPETYQHMKENRFNCNLVEIKNKYSLTNVCENHFERKCYQCFQQGFRDFLLQIVNGVEYPDIEDLNNTFFWCSEIGATRTEPTIIEKRVGTFKYNLEGSKVFVLSFNDFVNGPMGNSYQAFNDFFYALASYSLSEFLLSNDRRKIKLCPYCERFFIAKDIKRKRCYSESCSREYEKEKKRKQRDDDPLTYM